MTVKSNYNIEMKKTGHYSMLGYATVASQTRDGLSYSNASGDEHMQYQRDRLIAQSRDFLRNNGIYKGLIEQAVNYVIATGFQLQMSSKSKTYNDRVEALRREEWKRPEIRGILSGRMLERMTCRELLVAGDVGFIKVKGGKLQQIESEQIAKGYGKDGIEKNDYGMPLRYWVSPYSQHGRIQGPAKAKQYSPDQFIFITNPDRPSSTRGVPAAQASFPSLHRINDVCDSEALAWQILSRLAVSITRSGAADSAYLESAADPQANTSANSADLALRITDLGTALVFNGEPGDEVKGIERNLPSQNFTESIQTFLRIIGLPLGMPLELILLDWTKSNYSQTRAVLEHAYQTFIGIQSLLEDFFYKPILEWQIQRWVADGLIAKRPDGLNHSWIKPTFPWIDALKEAQAHGAKLDRSFTTHSHVCKSLGIDREEVLNTRDSEIIDAINRAKEIQKTTGVEVSWKTLAGFEEKNAISSNQGSQEDDDSKQKQTDIDNK